MNKCNRCGETLTKDNYRDYMLKTRNYLCNKCRNEYARQWREKNKEKLRKNQKRYKENFIRKYGLEELRKRERKRCMDYRIGHRNEAIERTTKWKKELIVCVLVHYGGDPPKCACCGESHIEFLTIDHIQNDGAEQRKRLFGDSRQGGIPFYFWLKKNNFPEGYQVLCYNCNCGKARNGGICPHKRW